MATRSWNGGTGKWDDATQWTTISTGDAANSPQPGDTLTVATGDPDLTSDGENNYGSYDDEKVTLNDGAAIHIDGANLGTFFTVYTTGSARLDFTGSEFADAEYSIDGSTGTTFTLAGPTTSGDALALTGNSYFYLANGAKGSDIDLSGTIDFESRNGTQFLSSVTNTGDMTIIGCSVELGSLSGTGTFNLQTGGSLKVDGACAAGQTIDYGSTGGTLSLSYTSGFASAITGFQTGNFIDVTDIKSTSASYNMASDTLTLYASDGSVAATLADVQAQAGTMIATSDGASGTLIGYASSKTLLQSELAMGSQAMKADVARAGTLPGTTTPVSGAGVKIGIISDSFNTNGGANADAAAGYLPANADGTSAVHVINNGSGEDEGRAMAELIHQVAPKAQLSFDAAGNTLESFAAAVTALQNDGCNIIVDDYSFSNEAAYQPGSSPVDVAINAAINAGVNYFTSADNNGSEYYESAYNPTSNVTVSGVALQANTFTNGTPYLNVQYSSGDYIKLDWDAPWKGVDGQGAPEVLKAEVLDPTGKVVATSVQNSDNGTKVASELLHVPTSQSGKKDRIVVFTPNGQATVDQFKLTYLNTYGEIDDPGTGTGSGSSAGHELLSGVNAVGAEAANNSSVFAQQAGYNESFSAFGPGEILYDADGKLLTTAQSADKPDFTAPDGITTSVGADFQPFYGTSAAAPNAAAVAALMLQANPNLTTTQVTALLKQSAIKLSGAQARQQGAGLIQADKAVAYAESPLSLGGDGTGAYTEMEIPGTVDGTLTINDHSSGISGATVAISSDGLNGDMLNFTTQNGISGSFNGQVLTLSGNATAAAYQAALRSVTFSSTNQNPTGYGNDTARTLTISVTDQAAFQASTTSTVAVTGVDNAPVLSGDNSISVVQGGTVTITTAHLAASDPDNTAAQLAFRVTETTDGSVLLNGAATTSFTEADLENGLVVFQQDGTRNTAAGFSVTVSDGTLATGPVTVAANVDLVPIVTGIVPSTTGPSNTNSLTETVMFSEAVRNVSIDDFSVTGTNTATAVVASLTPIGTDGTTYAVDLDSISGDGSLRLDLRPGTGIRDSSGNPAPAFATGGATTVDHTVPTITAVSDSGPGIDANGNGDVGAGETVTITATTSEAVTVEAAANGAVPTLTLNDGAAATYDPGQSTSTNLVFTYTVQPGDNTPGNPPGLVIRDIQGHGSSVTDAAGNPIDLDSLATAAEPTGTLVIDTTAPTAASVTDTVAQNEGATAIGIAAPSDNLTAAGDLTIASGALPTDGTVTLANGIAVTTGETLTAAQLTGLLFTPTAGVSSQGSTFTYTVTDGAGNTSTGTAALNIGAAGAPIIAGSHASTTMSETPVAPFSGVMVVDPSSAAGSTETLTITLTGGGGGLTGTGLTANLDGTYQLTGSASAVSINLETLRFTPTTGAAGTTSTTTFVLTDASSAGTSVTNAGTSVIDTDPAATPSPIQPTPTPKPAPALTPITPDTVAINSAVSFKDGIFTLLGQASSTTGMVGVEISAILDDGTRQDLGSATLNGDGNFTYADNIGANQQDFIEATLTDGAGVQTVSADPGFSLTGGLDHGPFRARQTSYTDGGMEETSTSLFRAGGSRKVDVQASDQTLTSDFFDTFNNGGAPSNTFVFDPGFGRDVVNLFRIDGDDHDSLSLKGSDYGTDPASQLASVLNHSRDTSAGLLITNPTASSTGSHDKVVLSGVTKSQLVQNERDITFHA